MLKWIEAASSIPLSVGMERSTRISIPGCRATINSTPPGRQRAPMTSLLPILRRAAPRLTRQFFQRPHHRCLPRVAATRADLFREASPKQIRAFKSSARRVSSAASRGLAPEVDSSSSLSSLSKSIGQDARKTKRGFFPNKSEKSVAYWLLGSAASVFGIVVFGGLTRLTESGYAALFQHGWQDADCLKLEYHRMEASNR